VPVPWPNLLAFGKGTSRATLARNDLSCSRRTSGDTRLGEAQGSEVFVVLVVHAGLTSTPVLVLVFCGG
jgi:hypothetical protein